MQFFSTLFLVRFADIWFSMSVHLHAFEYDYIVLYTTGTEEPSFLPPVMVSYAMPERFILKMNNVNHYIDLISREGFIRLTYKFETRFFVNAQGHYRVRCLMLQEYMGFL